MLHLRDNYLAELALLETKGKYEEMYTKSEEMLIEYPNDLMANWYKASSSYQTGQFGNAISALGRIKQINRVWISDAVDEYFDQIKSEMHGPVEWVPNN